MIKNFNLSILMTDHDKFNYQMISKNSKKLKGKIELKN